MYIRGNWQNKQRIFELVIPNCQPPQIQTIDIASLARIYNARQKRSNAAAQRKKVKQLSRL